MQEGEKERIRFSVNPPLPTIPAAEAIFSKPRQREYYRLYKEILREILELRRSYGKIVWPVYISFFEIHTLLGIKGFLEEVGDYSQVMNYLGRRFHADFYKAIEIDEDSIFEGQGVTHIPGLGMMIGGNGEKNERIDDFLPGINLLLDKYKNSFPSAGLIYADLKGENVALMKLKNLFNGEEFKIRKSIYSLWHCLTSGRVYLMDSRQTQTLIERNELSLEV